MSRPLMSAVAAQQAVLDDIRRDQVVISRQIAAIARLAGITPEIEDIAKTADIANPAQPVPDPGEQAPEETTEQAVTPATNDDVRAPGQTGGSAEHVPATATDVAIQPGGTMPTAPYNSLQDATAPVSGTNTGEVGGEQTRIETDVRVGDPMNPDVAFPWTISDNQSNSNPVRDGEMGQAVHGNRSFASLRLARLRIAAGLAKGEDLTVAAAIDADTGMTADHIDREIAVLDRVSVAANKKTAQAPTGTPRRSKTARTAPSLASPPAGLSATASAADDSMLFLSEGDLSGL